MTRERIEDMREVVLPFVQKRLLETNYENLGESDAEMFAKDFDEILNLAIKALEQQPTTKNNLGVDCVARQDVERYIEGFINEYTPKEELEFINLELDGLKHLPSVIPQEPKTGHWIEEFNDLEGEVRFTCSCCGKYQLFGTDFCYNCGAKMIELQERSDKE